MKTIDNYMDIAKEKNGLKSDNKLAHALGLKNASVSNWRTKKAWPADDTMVKLAELAEISPEQGLLELSYWRSEGKAKETYNKILTRLTASLAGLMIVFKSTAANAAIPLAQGAMIASAIPSSIVSGLAGLYILWKIKRIFKKSLRLCYALVCCIYIMKSVDRVITFLKQ